MEKTLIAYLSAQGTTVKIAKTTAKLLEADIIWYGCAPNVVNTFCKGYDWTGKKVAAIATSGGGGIGKTADKLKPYVNGAVSVDAKLVHNDMEVKNWVETI